MQCYQTKQTWFYGLLLVLAAVIVSPWKLGVDLSIDRYISLPETYALIFLLFIVYFRRFIVLPVKAAKIMLTLALLVMVALITVYFKAGDQGLFAQYFTNSSWSGAPEKSAFNPNEQLSVADQTKPMTRIDKQLNFSPRGFDLAGNVFPAFFLNDEARYGGEYVTQERLFAHKHFLFSSKYSGFIQVPEDTSLSLVVQSGKGAITINGEHCEAEVHCSIPVTGGTHPIEVTFQRLSTTPPVLSLYWGDAHAEHIVPSRFLRLSDAQLPLSTLLVINTISYALVISLLFILLLAIKWRSLWVACKDEFIVFALCALGGVYFLMVCYQKGSDLSAVIFSPGNDWLVYETQASTSCQSDCRV